MGIMLPEQLIRLTELLAAHRHRSPHTFGKYAGGSGDFYSRLVNGHDLTTQRAVRVLQWFDDHWPEDLDWPSDIPRPSIKSAA